MGKRGKNQGNQANLTAEGKRPSRVNKGNLPRKGRIDKGNFPRKGVRRQRPEVLEPEVGGSVDRRKGGRVSGKPGQRPEQKRAKKIGPNPGHRWWNCFWGRAAFCWKKGPPKREKKRDAGKYGLGRT